MSLPRFLMLDLAGSTLWVGAFLAGGMLFRDQLQDLAIWLEQLGIGALALLTLLVSCWLLWKYIRRRMFIHALRIAAITPAEVLKKLETVDAPLIVDLRHHLDFSSNPIKTPGAVRIDPNDLENGRQELPQNRETVLYCTCPNMASSAHIARLLQKQGIEKVRPLPEDCRAGFLEGIPWKGRTRKTTVCDSARLECDSLSLIIGPRRRLLMKEFDVIWIGTGQATGIVVPRLTEQGKTVAIAEGGRFGGSCVNYGCTPTKTIVASARAAHMARRGPDFGVRTGEISIDFKRVMERQNEIRHSGSEGMEKWLSNMENVTVFKEFATFSASHTIQVGEERIWGETIVINAGARPGKLDIDGLDDVEWLNNRRLLALEELPEHLIIVGGGYISLEFAQAFRRFGSRVTILERSSRLMTREDPDISKIVQEVFSEEGIEIVFNSEVQRVSQRASAEIEIDILQDGSQKTISGSHLLLAVGRVPNSDRLGLEKAGITTDDRGYIQVNDVMQTNVPHVFAVGDINGEGAFTHTSVNDGEIFWDHYSNGGQRTLTERIPTYALFVDPPLGRVGMTEQEARKSGRNVLMATRPMRRISRAREKDETAGLVKILVDGDTEEFLGVAVLGVGGDEVVNMFTPFMYAKQTYKLFRKAVLTHPTVAELMPWILDDLEPLTPK